MFGLDGTHSKIAKYRRVVLTFVGRDGKGNNLTVAFGIVHSENEDNIQWFFRDCCAADLTFDAIPLFCDCDHIIGASEKLALDGIRLNIKFCTIHIIRNVRKELKHRGQDIANAIFQRRRASHRS
ncbi:hypothetical protein PHMEG_0006776 [Phytophthora megakarya]|uniref:MULE transposase domain-containing protein n=1 Tax=Phytophthora megakarya TaxID=4795 RepID=A0A225WQ72_9STRA|nr:hypothetical protein PHMEG_0006776 [Phytophthora megakarya]